jgi:hypothetical protein
MTTEVQSKASMKRENYHELRHMGFSHENAELMQKLAKAVHRRFVNDCNGMATRTDLNLYRKAMALAGPVRLQVRFNSDPRGWPILLDKDPIADNDTFDKFRVCPY